MATKDGLTVGGGHTQYTDLVSQKCALDASDQCHP